MSIEQTVYKSVSCNGPDCPNTVTFEEKEGFRIITSLRRNMLDAFKITPEQVNVIKRFQDLERKLTETEKEAKELGLDLSHLHLRLTKEAYEEAARLEMGESLKLVMKLLSDSSFVANLDNAGYQVDFAAIFRAICDVAKFKVG